MEGKREEDAQRVSCTRRSFPTEFGVEMFFPRRHEGRWTPPHRVTVCGGGAKEAVIRILSLLAASETDVLRRSRSSSSASMTMTMRKPNRTSMLLSMAFLAQR